MKEIVRAIMTPQTLSIAALVIVIITLLDIVGELESKPYHFVLLLAGATLGLAAQVWDYLALRQGDEAPTPDERGAGKPTDRGGP